jgi:hypothetical protein
MNSVTSLNPKVSQQEALALLDPAGVAGFLGRAVRGPLRMVASVYIPYRLFRVEVINGSRRENFLLAVDTVSGQLDPYRFQTAPDASAFVEVETRNRPEPLLSDHLAGEIARDKARRLVFSSGFFRIRHFSVRAEAEGLAFHIPYWIGFFGTSESANLSVVDAVRRRVEGSKARQFFRDWLDSEKDTRSVQAMRQSMAHGFPNER